MKTQMIETLGGGFRNSGLQPVGQKHRWHLALEPASGVGASHLMGSVLNLARVSINWIVGHPAAVGEVLGVGNTSACWSVLSVSRGKLFFFTIIFTKFNFCDQCNVCVKIFFCIWKFNCSSMVCWKDYFFFPPWNWFFFSLSKVSCLYWVDLFLISSVPLICISFFVLILYHTVLIAIVYSKSCNLVCQSSSFLLFQYFVDYF